MAKQVNVQAEGTAVKPMWKLLCGCVWYTFAFHSNRVCCMLCARFLTQSSGLLLN